MTQVLNDDWDALLRSIKALGLRIDQADMETGTIMVTLLEPEELRAAPVDDRFEDDLGTPGE